ncbi:Hypothetical_protein [Hexamita inflata]|uniref:Hypothetical_protein n=1 Tax=Hexamita inflata TaxID=28002 RepID=A0AA86P6R0_9EUKA|nr:Hypothetical protein HINF_LOCUS20368 [Hexamita inflata]CAI9967715.1 Hypothetical protein HINF_LOCUS55360 [Hexamita inflata]
MQNIKTIPQILGRLNSITANLPALKSLEQSSEQQTNHYSDTGSQFDIFEPTNKSSVSSSIFKEVDRMWYLRTSSATQQSLVDKLHKSIHTLHIMFEAIQYLQDGIDNDFEKMNKLFGNEVKIIRYLKQKYKIK